MSDSIDSTAEVSSAGLVPAPTRRSTRFYEEENTLKRKIGDEIDILMEEYEKAREDSIEGLSKLKERMMGPIGQEP